MTQCENGRYELDVKIIDEKVKMLPRASMRVWWFRGLVRSRKGLQIKYLNCKRMATELLPMIPVLNYEEHIQSLFPSLW